MTRRDENSRMIREGLVKKLFEDPRPIVRLAAAKYLGEIADPKAIPFLCQALESELDPDVIIQIMAALSKIQRSLSTRKMSETPKVQMNFNAPVSGVAGNVEGDMIVNPEPKTPAESAEEIQALLKQLEAINPTTTEAELVSQIIKNNPTLKAK